MTRIYDKEVNKIDEYNWLHYIINLTKHNKLK